jgi:hypothetical protein
MAINTSKVVAGGLAAGVVLNIIDYLANGVLLADRMRADANAFKPGLGDEMAAMTGGQMAGYVIMNFVVGMLLVWTYAGFRARFGPGPKTATYVALVFFTLGMILTMGYMNMGIMSSGLWWTYAALWLINLLVASMVGGKVYSEDG